MTTQHYFDNFLQVGDRMKVVGDSTITPLVQEHMNEEGEICELDYEHGLIGLRLDNDRGVHMFFPQETEPMEYREEPHGKNTEEN